MRSCAVLVLEAGSEDRVVLLDGHSPLHWQGAAEQLVSFVDQLHPDEQDSEEGTAATSHPVGMLHRVLDFLPV